MTRNLVFFLEERSSAEMLRIILPQLVPQDITPFLFAFEGKQDLEKNLESKIRGWRRPYTKFVVIRDMDSEDCHVVKTRLTETCRRGGRPDSLVRIACHELESFYLGDLSAVAQAYDMPMPSQTGRKYRAPDNLANAAEELKKITKKEYQKLDGSRRIAAFLKTDGSNTSSSFNALITGLKRIVAEPFCP